VSLDFIYLTAYPSHPEKEAMTISKPAPEEYNDFYQKYIDLVTQPHLIDALITNREAVLQLFQSIPAEIEVFRYDTNKWSIKEVLMHIIDFERYLSFKALVSLRNDVKTIVYHPNRDEYLFHSHPETRSLADIVPEFVSVRNATISLFEHAGSPQLSLVANHINNAHGISARALGFATAGHSIHHLKVIREKYLRLSQAK
jgi:hypothetical protein